MKIKQLILIYPPVRARCFPDENPISFLVRLAKLNKYPSYRWLLSGKRAGTINYELLYETLLTADWTGYKQAAPELREICCLPNTHMNSSRLRYCPLCLKEGLYWNIGWQIKLAVACSKHQVWLHDLCPNCHSEQSFIKTRENKCKCSEKRLNAIAVAAPQSILHLQQFLEQGLPNQEHKLFDANHWLSMVKRCELIVFMLEWLEIREELTNPEKQKFQYVTDFQNGAVKCAEALFFDQSSFWRFLQTIHLSCASHIDIQQRRLITFYRQFYRQFSSPAFRPLRDVVENYVTMNLIRDITKKHTLFSPDARKDQLWYSFQKACKEYGIAGSVLSRAITDKQVNVYHKRTKINYAQCAIYRPDLEKILPFLKELIPASDAVKILGVTKAQFAQLQNSGCFKFEIPPRKDYCSIWQYSQQELENLIENINLGAASSTTDCLTISKIMKTQIKGNIEKPFLQVFKAIFSGQLIVRKPDAKLQKIRDLLIDKKEFMYWLRSLRSIPDSMSVTEASKLLGINEEFGYQLVNYGYLQHEIDSRKAKTISLSHIRQFNQEYVILSKLSEKSGISSARIVDMLLLLNIFPVDHNDSNKLRQKLYTRANILKTILFYRYVHHLLEISL